jgi:hypothetical protein
VGVILTPQKWFRLATPSRLLFGDAMEGKLGIEPGDISPLTLTGSSTGTIEVVGIAIDAFTCRLRCDRGGEVNVSETANPGALPMFSLSMDGGATFARSRVVSDNRDTAVIDATALGLRFKFQNGDPAPSFVAGDTWAFTTAPSPDIEEIIGGVEDEIIEAAAGSFDPEITAVPRNWTKHAAWMARWELYCKIGVQRQQDLKVHYPKRAYEWMEGLRGGRNAVKAAARGVVEKAPGTSFNDWAKPQTKDPWAPPI